MCVWNSLGFMRRKKYRVTQIFRIARTLSRGMLDLNSGSPTKRLLHVIDLIWIWITIFVIHTLRPQATSHGHEVRSQVRGIAVPHSAPEARLPFNGHHRAYKRHSQVSETVPVHTADRVNTLKWNFKMARLLSPPDFLGKTVLAANETPAKKCN